MPTLRELREGLIRSFRGRIDDLQQQLDAFENLGMRTGERQYGGPWVDTTERDKQRVRDGIADYERALAHIREELGDA